MIRGRRLAGNLFELFVETGEILEAALVANLLNCHIVAEQHFTGISDPDFDQKLRELFAGAGFKVPAK
jgi:hypothetical protein